MKKFILSVCLSVSLIIIFAQNNNGILFKVGDDVVTATEFINTFNRNNSIEKATEAEVRDYLDLYINFKLKVRDGFGTQIDTVATFQKELASYRSQSAQSYLVDKEITEHLITEAIERSKFMIRASHILVQCKEDASPKDSLDAYNKIMDIRKKINSGAITFPEAAVLYSEDPSAKDETTSQGKLQRGNKGDLRYFTVFDLIYPFETAAYNTPVGSYSMPIRTRFGYHLIWVQDKQPTVSKINISQILLLDTAAISGNYSAGVKEKLTLIEEAIKKGEDFTALAIEYTDDPTLKKNNGNADPFSPNLRPGDFVKQCIALENNQISKPFASEIGWHVIKLNELEKSEIADDELRYLMISKIQKDSRSTKSIQSLIDKLKKEYVYIETDKNKAFELIINKINVENKFPQTKELLEMPEMSKLKPIASFANETITIQDFIQVLERFQGMEMKKQAKTFLNDQYNNFIKDKILKYEFENLENKYPEYQELIREYHHGMILFEMNNKRVWEESLKDSANIETYFEKNKHNYINSDGKPKQLTEIRSIVLTDYQNDLEREWLAELKSKYPIWINEELLKSIIEKK